MVSVSSVSSVVDVRASTFGIRKALLIAAICLSAIALPRMQSVSQWPGAADAWLKMQKLRTTVSVMHITAHPDDEHGGVLAKLSRGDGARVTMLTLTRGESGDNAIGPQLFDALGLIRTEELLVSNRYYGVDQQYFTTVVDYGYSKLLEEAMTKWGRDTVLRDVVRIIRMERPTIILSRFQGSDRDGHANHQAAGLMAQEAFLAAGDANRYPEQIREGLRPWSPAKIYVGGVRADEDWTVRVDTGEYDPVLGDTYENVARRGLSFQRSQNSGRFTRGTGSNYVYYKLAAGLGAKGQGTKEQSLFDSLPRTMEDAIGQSGRAIDDAVSRAVAAFAITNPPASAPALAQGLTLARAVATSTNYPLARQLMRIKEQQFQAAINAASGARVVAFANLSGPPVPGQTFTVDAQFEMNGKPVESSSLRVTGESGWRVEPAGPSRFRVTLAAADVPLSTRSYFSRSDLHENVYRLSDASQFGRPVSVPPLTVSASYGDVEVRASVMRRESRAPYGDKVLEVRSVPRIAVNVTPAHAIVPVRSAFASGGTSSPAASADRVVDLEVSLLHNGDVPSFGQVTLQLPEGWTAKPGSQAFRFERPGEKASFRFLVRPAAIREQTYEIDVVAIDGLGEYREGYELIDHRDLEPRYLYRQAKTTVRGVNVTTAAGVKVGYVMGIGDQVPVGLQQLGAQVTLLTERDLAAANLSQYDTIMTGTRAYAVRDDLKTHNARLLDYVRSGGNMVVLYNTQELVPNTFAPYPGELPRTAEEVSEEDSPVMILMPQHRALTWPNRITAADFDGWVEQRGSKFFSKWDGSYTPLIATNDRGQPPQMGGWLTARVGKGTWTYFAYALHRQLPYGVPGAYRITANLLALNKQPK
jgi:LmbE family N-acetylglucosaminyl deacetylase